MRRLELNTVVSRGFRVAVAIHLTCLYVLIFGLKSTLFGGSHYFAAAILTLLMGIIVVLFVADLLTADWQSRKLPSLVDGILGVAWIAIVGFLISNSLRVGIW